MKPLVRCLLAFNALVLLLLGIIASLLWTRSYRGSVGFSYGSFVQQGVDETKHTVEILCKDGVLWVERTSVTWKANAEGQLFASFRQAILDSVGWHPALSEVDRPTNSAGEPLPPPWRDVRFRRITTTDEPFRIQATFLTVPAWAFVGLIAITLYVYLRWLRKDLVARRNIRRGLCPKCGYDMRFSRDICPECGTKTVDIRVPRSHNQ
jgi:hypothetical protein